MESHEALDLFAGHGWGVALKERGVQEHAVEIMPEAQATRAANGMGLAYEDVWDAHKADGLTFDTLIASPPCPTFSMQGPGHGRRAIGDVVRLVETSAHLSVHDLRRVGDDAADDRGLLLTPLYYAFRYEPEYIVLEQVPTVLPVWAAFEKELGKMGYSTWSGILSSETFGVPQVRKRAILIARRDGVAARPPKATHSAYYSHSPARLDDGVKPWVSMVDVLGWGLTQRPSPTVTGHVLATREPIGRQKVYLNAIANGDFIFRPPYDYASARKVNADDTSLSRSFAGDAVNMATAEAGVIQSYPANFNWQGGKNMKHLQIGNAVPPLMGGAILDGVWARDGD